MSTQAQTVIKTPRSRFQKRARRIVMIIVSLGLVAVFTLLAQTPAQQYVFSTTTVTGDKVSLADYRGHVVMVNFWATWCPPCQAEMPVIEKTYEQFQNRGFVVLAVNSAERADQVGAFAKHFQLTFPVLLDYSADIQQQFGIKGLPTSLFLDAKGQLYATHQGMLTSDQLQSYIQTGLQRSV